MESIPIRWKDAKSWKDAKMWDLEKKCTNIEGGNTGSHGSQDFEETDQAMAEQKNPGGQQKDMGWLCYVSLAVWTGGIGCEGKKQDLLKGNDGEQPQPSFLSVCRAQENKERFFCNGFLWKTRGERARCNFLFFPNITVGIKRHSWNTIYRADRKMAKKRIRFLYNFHCWPWHCPCFGIGLWCKKPPTIELHTGVSGEQAEAERNPLNLTWIIPS